MFVRNLKLQNLQIFLGFFSLFEVLERQTWQRYFIFDNFFGLVPSQNCFCYAAIWIPNQSRYLYLTWVWASACIIYFYIFIKYACINKKKPSLSRYAWNYLGYVSTRHQVLVRTLDTSTRTSHASYLGDRPVSLERPESSNRARPLHRRNWATESG